MVNRRFLAAALAAAATTVAFSGCFGFFGLTWSNPNLRPNPPKKSKTVAKIRSQPLLTEAQKDTGAPEPLPGRDYPFFLIDSTDDEFVFRAGAARFDVPGKFGPRGGRTLVRDEDLEDVIAAQTDPEGLAVCGNDFSLEDFRVYRTENRVRDRGKVREKTFSTLPFRQLGLTDGLGGGATIQIGTWWDDGDGVPEALDQEFIGCSGGGFFDLNLKEGPTDFRATRERWAFGD